MKIELNKNLKAVKDGEYNYFEYTNTQKVELKNGTFTPIKGKKDFRLHYLHEGTYVLYNGKRCKVSEAGLSELKDSDIAIISSSNFGTDTKFVNGKLSFTGTENGFKGGRHVYTSCLGVDGQGNVFFKTGDPESDWVEFTHKD